MQLLKLFVAIIIIFHLIVVAKSHLDPFFPVDGKYDNGVELNISFINSAGQQSDLAINFFWGNFLRTENYETSTYLSNDSTKIGYIRGLDFETYAPEWIQIDFHSDKTIGYFHLTSYKKVLYQNPYCFAESYATSDMFAVCHNDVEFFAIYFDGISIYPSFTIESIDLTITTINYNHEISGDCPYIGFDYETQSIFCKKDITFRYQKNFEKYELEGNVYTLLIVIRHRNGTFNVVKMKTVKPFDDLFNIDYDKHVRYFRQEAENVTNIYY